MTNDIHPERSIKDGRCVLGIELGSTRIKAVLLDENRNILTVSSHEWENLYENGVWTYRLEDVWSGLQDAYSKLKENCRRDFGAVPSELSAMGISAMMHGYLAFDRSGDLLVPFRTWRNSITKRAADALSAEFSFNVPQRWSVAHLYESILNNEPHVEFIDFLTTLSGYVHWKLTGSRVLGLDDASGMFPIDFSLGDYDRKLLDRFDRLTADRHYPWKLADILPKALPAGSPAGVLSEQGALLLDPDGTLRPGIPLCPPEGDAGTGMVATDSVAPRSGNVSAGTSIFAMAVLEKPLKSYYPEVDIVSTPAGDPVAMVHCNNCTTEFDSWVRLFKSMLASAGCEISVPDLYDLLYSKALDAENDCGGLLSYNYHSGEHVTGLQEGRPLFVRKPDSRFTLENFMRSQLYSSLCTLRIGLDILFCRENVALDTLLGHGGLFKTPGAGQRLLAAALGTPVSVLPTAGEGGAWGIALLADYMVSKRGAESLSAYLTRISANNAAATYRPTAEECAGFDVYLDRFKKGLKIESEALDSLV